MAITFLDEDAVRKHVRMDELIDAMGDALTGLSSGTAVQPVRVIVPVKEHHGFLGVMPAYHHALGAKVVTFYPRNTETHTHNGLILLFDPENGEPICVMDGRLITEMRTAAVSAAATKILAREDVSNLAILGSGVQARSHLDAMRIVRSFDKVTVWSPRNAAAFAEEHQVICADSAEEAVRDADVVVVATAATQPVLLGNWLSPGTHVNAVGANRPDWHELDDEVLTRSKIFVESRTASAVESGDLIAGGEIFAEIGEVFGDVRPGRQSSDEITLFKSLGAGVEDIAAADLVYRAAKREEAGS